MALYFLITDWTWKKKPGVILSKRGNRRQKTKYCLWIQAIKLLLKIPCLYSERLSVYKTWKYKKVGQSVEIIPVQFSWKAMFFPITAPKINLNVQIKLFKVFRKSFKKNNCIRKQFFEICRLWATDFMKNALHRECSTDNFSKFFQLFLKTPSDD